jgi:hypothetical protein
MLVKNMKVTSDDTCACGSWLYHWEIFTGQAACFCSSENCINNADLGAVVIKVDSADKNRYIVPLCCECNKAEGTIDIGNTPLAPATENETCS